jgi:hypothetical protein
VALRHHDGEGTPPATLVTRYTLGVDVIFADIPSNSIFGVQHASIPPTRRAAKNAAAAQKKGAAPATRLVTWW